MGCNRYNVKSSWVFVDNYHLCVLDRNRTAFLSQWNFPSQTKSFRGTRITCLLNKNTIAAFCTTFVLLSMPMILPRCYIFVFIIILHYLERYNFLFYLFIFRSLVNISSLCNSNFCAWWLERHLWNPLFYI